MDHLELYMKDLKRVKRHGYSKLLLVHTLSLEPEALMVDAESKIQEYVNYREVRLKKMLDFVKVIKFVH